MFPRGVVYIVNKIGPSTEPWGTPYFNVTGVDVHDPIWTVCVRSLRYDSNHLRATPLIPKDWFNRFNNSIIHILSRGPPTTCQHCGQTLTIKHMLLECTVLQQNRDEYYTVDSLGTLFETFPEACIVEILTEAGLFYLIWMAIYPEQPLIQISHQATRFWARFNPSNTTRFCNLFIELNQIWENPTCEGRLICPGGHVLSLNKCNPIQNDRDTIIFKVSYGCRDYIC